MCKILTLFLVDCSQDYFHTSRDDPQPQNKTKHDANFMLIKTSYLRAYML